MPQHETTVKPTRRELYAFLGLTFIISWPLWIASGVLPRSGAGPLDSRWLVAQVGVFGPSLAALILSGASRPDLRRNAVRMLLLFLPVFAVGLFIAAAVPETNVELGPLTTVLAAIAALAVVLFFAPWNRSLLMPGTGARHRTAGLRWPLLALAFPLGLFLLAWLLANLEGRGWEVSALGGGAWNIGRVVLLVFSINLLFGGSLGEEIGWRGFLLPRLLRAYSPFGASMLLGVVWALWHAPIDVTAGFVVVGPVAIFGRLVLTLPLSVLFTWFYIKSNGDLLVALMLHTGLNVVSDFGFSNFESSMGLWYVILLFVGVVLSFSATMREKDSAQVE